MAEKEKMLVTQALDTRDFLLKKITSDIESFSCIAVKRKKDPTLLGNRDIEKFKEEAKSKYDSINGQIDRYRRLCAAIIQSNAETKVTVFGKEMTVAEAISKKKMLAAGTDPEIMLVYKITKSYSLAVSEMDRMRRNAEQLENDQKANLISTRSGNDKNSPSNEDEIRVLDTLCSGNYPELIDPINVEKAIDDMNTMQSKQLQELETAIKISNATTVIEF